MVLLSTDNTYQWADGVYYLLIIPIIGLMVLLSTDNTLIFRLKPLKRPLIGSVTEQCYEYGRKTSVAMETALTFNLSKR